MTRPLVAGNQRLLLLGVATGRGPGGVLDRDPARRLLKLRDHCRLKGLLI